MPDPEDPVGGPELRDRSTKIEFSFEHELFNRGVRKITICDAPHPEVDAGIKGVGFIVLFDDGTTERYYGTLSARRPVGIDDPYTKNP